MVFSKDNDQTLRDLLRAARAGDKRAYAQFLQGLLPMIRAQLGGHVPQDRIDDISQEVLISVHKALPTYDAARPLGAWLQAIVKFRKADYLRSHYSRQVETGVADITATADSVLAEPGRTAEWKDIEAALKKLPEKQRRILDYLRIHGFSVDETAKLVGISPSDVKVSAHRATLRLKELLHE